MPFGPKRDLVGSEIRTAMTVVGITHPGRKLVPVSNGAPAENSTVINKSHTEA
jgi:hypothetical protein